MLLEVNEEQHYCHGSSSQEGDLGALNVETILLGNALTLLEEEEHSEQYAKDKANAGEGGNNS